MDNTTQHLNNQDQEVSRETKINLHFCIKTRQHAKQNQQWFQWCTESNKKPLFLTNLMIYFFSTSHKTYKNGKK